MPPIFAIFSCVLVLRFAVCQTEDLQVKNVESSTATYQLPTTLPTTLLSTVSSTINDTFTEINSKSTENLLSGGAFISVLLETSTNSPSISTSTTTELASTTLPPCLNNTIANLTYSEHETYINLTLRVELTCQPTKLNVTCQALADFNNLSLSWVIPEISELFDLPEEDIFEDITLTFNGLSEFTNYTCFALYMWNETEASDAFYFNVTTLETVSSEPENLEITSTSSSTLEITWLEPSKIPSKNFDGYNVSIIRKGVASEGHFYCSDPQQNVTDYVNVTRYVFSEALPDFEYEVLVSGWSNIGVGQRAEQTFNTPSSVADSPSNVKNLTEEQDHNRSIITKIYITWDMPCNTNGPVAYFQIDIFGYYLYNHRITSTQSAMVEVSDQVTYKYRMDDVLAAFNYTVTIYLVDQSGDNKGFRNIFYLETNENYPSAPGISSNETSVNATHLSFSWLEPDNNPGEITQYKIMVNSTGLNWLKLGTCAVDSVNFTVTTMDNEYSLAVVPDATYHVFISAFTTRGEGNVSLLTTTSSMTEPDPLTNLKYTLNKPTEESYDVCVNISFTPGCFNGNFTSYEVYWNGTRENFEGIFGNDSIKYSRRVSYRLQLLPDYEYNVTFKVANTGGYYSKDSKISFVAPSGVPKINDTTISTIKLQSTDDGTKLTLKREYFDETQGTLKYLAIIVSDRNVTGGDFNKWTNSDQWPEVKCYEASIYYQATPQFWDPFIDSDVVHYVFGQDDTCDDPHYCNKPLEPGKQYFVLLRLFNNNFYRNTMPITFTTDAISKLGLILGLIFGLLLVSCSGFLLFMLWKRGIIKNPFQKDPPGPPTEIPQDKFIQYSTLLEENPQILQEQWAELEEKSKEIYEPLECNFSTMPQNKRKNRYTNILPFDHSRVKLNIDEDDEMGSDYINASYVKGFSNDQLYIATQGPLPSTCRDFWKMILQENVGVIVMVARFVENNKEKCYKYFPNNHETMTIGDDIEVRCSTELHFGIYCIRKLQVKKDLKQVSVTHMQYLEWPDFGVPKNTENILQFCHQFKERWANEGGAAVIHCSAGVGRTGTLIATDILVRAIKAGKKIDVFNTVLNLRQQRKSMVQTEKQYLYIYQLVSYMLEFPIPDEEDSPEHVYENITLEVIPKDISENNIAESAF